MRTFTLRINLDNDVMSDAPPIADALRKVADDLDRDYVGCDPIEPVPTQSIFDVDGNRVGGWAIVGRSLTKGD